MKYWLFKSEPETYSLDDLKKSKNKTAYWDGVRETTRQEILHWMK